MRSSVVAAQQLSLRLLWLSSTHSISMIFLPFLYQHSRTRGLHDEYSGPPARTQQHNGLFSLISSHPCISTGDHGVHPKCYGSSDSSEHSGSEITCPARLISPLASALENARDRMRLVYASMKCAGWFTLSKHIDIVIFLDQRKPFHFKLPSPAKVRLRRPPRVSNS